MSGSSAPHGEGQTSRTKAAREAWAQEIDAAFRLPPVVLGPGATHSMHTDPKHLCFVLSRYKLCAKLLAGKKKAVEVGCGDGFGLPLVAETVGELLAVDNEPRQIADNQTRLGFVKNCRFEVWDFVDKPHPERFDAAYSIDVIEHIDAVDERRLFANLIASLTDDAVAVVGTPNVEASRHSSRESQACHINLKSAGALRALMETYFVNVFIFSMNDEVVHTGYHPMAHYLMALGVGKRQ